MAKTTKKEELVKEDSVTPTTEGIKTLEQKTAEIKEQAEDIGMHDPSTNAKIAAMETATPREERTESIQSKFDDRDAVREAKADELADVVESRRPNNEMLSKKMVVEKEADEKLSEVDRKVLTDKGEGKLVEKK